MFRRRHAALGTAHRIGWENNKQTTETMDPTPETMKLRINKNQWNKRSKLLLPGYQINKAQVRYWWLTNFSCWKINRLFSRDDTQMSQRLEGLRVAAYENERFCRLKFKHPTLNTRTGSEPFSPSIRSHNTLLLAPLLQSSDTCLN